MIIDSIRTFSGTCIIHENNHFSYKELTDQIHKYIIELKKELSKNDTVVIKSDYNFYSISLFISLTKFNINIVPIVDSNNDEFKKKLNVCYVDKIIEINNIGGLTITKRKSNKNKEFSEFTSTKQTGLILFSSGSTGKPKVMIQNFTLMLSLLLNPKRQRKLTFLIFLLFDHIGGINTLLNCLNNGSIIVIPNKRNPSNIIDLIYKHKINVLPTSPTFLNLIIMDNNFKKEKFESVKLITYGTERMSNSLLNRLNKNLPKVKFLQTFGTSETGILKTKSKSSDSLFFKIDDPDREYKIINNELYLKSKTSISGYKNYENKSFNDGWFATGDLVEVDDQSFIKIIGRKNDIINVGGLKVLPSEVENVINNIKGIIDCSVYGEENIIIGNIVCAKIIITKNSDSKEIKKEIKKICNSKLEKYKVPSKILFDYKIKHSKRFKKINEK